MRKLVNISKSVQEQLSLNRPAKEWPLDVLNVMTQTQATAWRTQLNNTAGALAAAQCFKRTILR